MCQHCNLGPESFEFTSEFLGVDIPGDIAEFHRHFGVPSAVSPSILSSEMAKFRIARLQEEVDEYREGIEEQDIAKQLDALVDLVYIAVGTSFISGHAFAEAWKRVHAANMLKKRAERAEESKHGTAFDIVKPEGWTAPTLDDLCRAKWDCHLNNGKFISVNASSREKALEIGEEELSRIQSEESIRDRETQSLEIEEVFQS